MLSFTGRRVFIVPGPTDMCKSDDGLSGVVRDRLGADPQSRELFVLGFNYELQPPRQQKRR